MAREWFAHFQPAHSPELNPIERLCQHLKQALKWQNYAKLDELRHRVSELLKAITPEVIVSICGWDHITSALLSATS